MFMPSRAASFGAKKINVKPNLKKDSTGCPKKMFPCFRGHNFLKNGVRNKSRVKSAGSFPCDGHCFIFNLWAMRKLGLKLVTPYLKL